MKSIILFALVFLASVSSQQQFYHLVTYTDNQCGTISSDLGYYVPQVCAPFNSFVLFTPNATNNAVRYQAGCTSQCDQCVTDLNIGLGTCTSETIVTLTSPTVNTVGTAAIELHNAGCTQLYGVQIRSGSECFINGATDSFYFTCGTNGNAVSLHSCTGSTTCGDFTCPVSNTYNNGQCASNDGIDYAIPSVGFIPYCNSYPQQSSTATGATAATTESATTTSGAAAAATTGGSTAAATTVSGSSATSAASSTQSATASSASATTTGTTTTGTAATTTGSTATSTQATTAGATTAAAATTTGATTAAAATTAASTTTTTAATTTTNAATTTTTTNAATTTTTTTTTNSGSGTTIRVTTSSSARMTVGILATIACAIFAMF